MKTAIVRIRPATEAEANYVRFRLKVVGMMWQDVNPVRSMFWVAEDGRDIIGFARLEFGLQGALLGSLYVEPEYRSSGLGRAIVKRLETEAYKRGRQQLHVFSTEKGEFFKSLGFEEVPVKHTVSLIGDTPQVEWYLRHPDLLANEVTYTKML